MRRALLISVVLLVGAWLQFRFVPGHTFLAGDSQAYVPMLQHLHSPGFLSRDIVATNPNLTYTAFDEVTLFIEGAAKIPLQRSLEAQALLFRLCLICGTFLLLNRAGIRGFAAAFGALLLEGAAHLLNGPITAFSREPVPGAFSFELTILAAGLFAYERPVLAAIAGGLAMLYDPAMAAPFWLLLVAFFVVDRRTRGAVRSTALVFAIYLLLLANLAQLQPAASDTRSLLDRVQPVFEAVSKLRNPWMWVSVWPAWFFAVLFAVALACAGVFPQWKAGLKKSVIWTVAGLPLCAAGVVFLSLLLLDVGRSAVVEQSEPARAVAYAIWFGVLVLMVWSLRLLRPKHQIYAMVIVYAVVLAVGASKLRRGTEVNPGPVAQWAESQTWGGSMFLFPDAGKELWPGAFRAEAKRATWVDWQTGTLVDGSDSFADEWSRRWLDTMEGAYSEARLKRLLLLPVDYIVLKREHTIATARPVFSTAALVVYDARDLRLLFTRVN